MLGEYTSGTPGAFDAHAHLDYLDDHAIAEEVASARSRGVVGWALCGADPGGWSRLREVAHRIGGLAQLGLHPWWAGQLDAPAQDQVLDELSGLPTPHGLGETGLDWHRARDPEAKRRQLRAFEAQVALARHRDVPVILHGVQAWGRVLDTLPKGIEGVLHGFTGSVEVARRAVKIGLYVSLGPAIHTHPRAQAAATAVPLEQLLIETDAPDHCAAADLIDVAHRVADLRRITPEELIAVTSSNAKRLFRAPGGP